MSDRKNIFLIGRRKGDEDQLTEMLAFLWQEQPDTLDSWLRAIGLPADVGTAGVETQFPIPSGRRPDIRIRWEEAEIVVESKLGAGFHETQVSSYLEYLGGVRGRRALVLLTERPETPLPADGDLAERLGVELISERWHDMAEHLGNPGEESLPGDFIQLLIQEGLVKPKPLTGEDWTAWNAGYNVLLRLDAFLGELDTRAQQLQPGSSRTTGLTKRWIYRLWRAGHLELGFGFASAESDRSPHTQPVVFAFVGNKNATEEDAMNAAGVDKNTRYGWTHNDQLNANCGLIYSWPALARWSSDVLTAPTFEDQVEQAAAFLRETRNFFESRGYLRVGSGA